MTRVAFWFSVWFLGTALVLIFLASRSHTQEHYHPPQDVQMHEKFYSNWMRPDDQELSCCNMQDCYPTEFKKIGRTWFAQRREDGEWIAIPPEKFEHNRDNPDGRNHVCMQPPGSADTVFCAILGGGT